MKGKKRKIEKEKIGKRCKGETEKRKGKQGEKKGKGKKRNGKVNKEIGKKKGENEMIGKQEKGRIVYEREEKGDRVRDGIDDGRDKVQF